jgi:alpha-mannosidase
MTSKEVRFYEQRIPRLIDYLPNYMYPKSVALGIEGVTDPEPIPFKALSKPRFKPMAEGQTWGKDWDSAWFRLHGRVPRDWAGKTVVARLNFGGEACVFSARGEPLQGLTEGSVFGHATRERYPLFSPCKGGEKVNLLVEAAVNSLFGIHRDPHPVPDKPYSEGKQARIECVRLCVFDEEMFHLWLDATVLYRLMNALPEREPQRAQLLHALTKAVDAFRYDTPNPGELRAILAPHLRRKGDETLLATTAVGHAHIDTGWLWPVRESIRKCARTFSSQLRLIEEYPGYVFGASAAQHYQFVKDHYPALYEGIRKAVADGSWEVQGATWVEADNNVPSGESLVRQILYGKLFFRDEFGVEVRNLWLPDVFGYSAALPQILRKAGVDFFLTQKISWSQFNRFPHHTFLWRGIDGTEILTHFPPEDNYNAGLEPDRLRYAAENFEERGFLPEFLTLFGIGDGGGGPTQEQVERGLRMRDLAGCPRLCFGKAQDALDRLQAHARELAVWNGELYLELHRGTLTTQARNKRLNRLVELHFRRTEMLWSCLPPSRYPQAELEQLWKTFLTNQFHDIIPGSSIREVYETSRREHEEVLAALDKLDERAVKLLRGSASRKTPTVTVFNPLSHAFRGAFQLPGVKGTALKTADGQLLPVQPDGSGGGWVAAELPGLSCRRFSVISESAPPPARSASAVSSGAAHVLENGLVRYEFDSQGRLARAFDKETGREVMRPNELGNVLSLYEDWPANWDAWDVDISYEQQLRETARLVSARISAAGPSLAALSFEFQVGKSSIRQEVRLPSNSRRLDFVTHVDWRECRKMLRVSFAVDVMAAEASYEIQFGAYRRPTHRNTTWDMAKFEVCGHRFVDLSDEGRGVALLNDCKYGHKVRENVLDTNLLRSTFHPDPTADRAAHDLTYSLLPHSGRLEDSSVVAEAHALNQPPLVFDGKVSAKLPCTVLGKGVVLDALKKAEREDAWVVRLYEPVGREAECELRLSDASAQLWEAGIMEDAQRQVPTENGSAGLLFRPFELKTLLIRLP